MHNCNTNLLKKKKNLSKAGTEVRSRVSEKQRFKKTA
jgi:hypothetical protein